MRVSIFQLKRKMENYQLKNKVTLFNTSHLYNNENMKEIKHYELHESPVQELWKSYSIGL